MMKQVMKQGKGKGTKKEEGAGLHTCQVVTEGFPFTSRAPRSPELCIGWKNRILFIIYYLPKLSDQIVRPKRLKIQYCIGQKKGSHNPIDPKAYLYRADSAASLELAQRSGR